MNVINTAGINVTSKSVEISKSVGSLVFTLSKEFEELSAERIEITLQRANNDNIRITDGAIPLKEFIMLGTMGDDAIGFGPDNMKTQAVVELVDDDLSAVHLAEKDLLLIKLTGLTGNSVYRVDGVEAPLTSDEIFTYERKNMNSEHENMDFDVSKYDAAVITDKASITEINLTFENGHTVSTNPFELRACMEAADPIARVKSDGTVLTSFPDYLQLPLKSIVKVNIKKTIGDVVSVCLRHDQDEKESLTRK